MKYLVNVCKLKDKYCLLTKSDIYDLLLHNVNNAKIEAESAREPKIY